MVMKISRALRCFFVLVSETRFPKQRPVVTAPSLVHRRFHRVQMQVLFGGVVPASLFTDPTKVSQARLLPMLRRQKIGSTIE